MSVFAGIIGFGCVLTDFPVGQMNGIGVDQFYEIIHLHTQKKQPKKGK